MKNRALRPWLTHCLSGARGRILVLTGARQTGKTTLIRQLLPDYAYVSFDDPVVREQTRSLSAKDWLARSPRVIFDEAQKVPAIFETVKAMYDQSAEARIILTGSSQILLMGSVRETLAGRAALAELSPLTLPELGAEGWDCPVRDSRWVAYLKNRNGGALLGVPALSDGYSRYARLWERVLAFGSFPWLWQGGESMPPDDECRDWLRDYVKTYLQRDVRDLAAFRELEPFVRAEQAIACQTGCLVNASSLAQTVGVAASTIQRFLRYLEISYQTLSLPAWSRNVAKRLAKTPKIHVADRGILRVLRDNWGELDGRAYESAVVAEMSRQVKAARLDVSFTHLRTSDGREIDLLVELPDGYVAIEIKQSRTVVKTDARHFLNLAALLDKPLLAGWVVSNDPNPRLLAEDATALPAAWLLSPSD